MPDEPKDPMPPFPQEPAFGSPKAVAQAAETIQGFTPGRPLTAQQGDPEPCIVLKGSRPVAFVSGLGNARLFAAAPDLLRELDALRVENERLFAELESLKAGLGLKDAFRVDLVAEAGKLADQRDALRAEVERLKAENATVESAVRTGIAGLERQRDALADALEAFIPAGCTCSGNDCLTARAALRLAGRLPATTKGDPE